MDHSDCLPIYWGNFYMEMTHMGYDEGFKDALILTMKTLLGEMSQKEVDEILSRLIEWNDATRNINEF